MRIALIIISIIISISCAAQSSVKLTKPLEGKTRSGQWVKYNPKTNIAIVGEDTLKVSRLIYNADVKAYQLYTKTNLFGRQVDFLTVVLYPSRWKYSDYYPQDGDWVLEQ